jgi:membrane protease YdiL (CAAX protease family)
LMLWEVVMFAVLYLVMDLSPTSKNWIRYHHLFVSSGLSATRAISWLFFTYLFSCTWSFFGFVEGVGLRRMPGRTLWWSVLIAVGIGLLNVYLVTSGWSPPDQHETSYHHQRAEIWLFHSVFISTLGPLYEEVTLRGFLYKAFRRSYGQVTSTVIVVGVTAYLHWNKSMQSAGALVCLFSLWTMLCILREKTNNVWNCVVCHAAYNFTLTLSSRLL